MKKTKSLGQHFLASRAVLNRILAVISPQADELIIEIGAGKGALTLPLAERCRKVIAIEKDPDLVAYLSERKKENIVILEGDVLRVDFGELLREEATPREQTKLVGNLPYSISTPLLFQILETGDFFSSCVFLLQKEVAERLSAAPGSKKYAPLSILFDIEFEVRLHFCVAPGSFFPPPRVHSALISMRRREKPLFAIADSRRFRLFLRTAFAHRRKTLLNNLKSFALPDAFLAATLATLGLPSGIRAEQVPGEKFVRLYEALESHFNPKNPRPITNRR